MSKFLDYYCDDSVKGVVDAFVERFPMMFETLRSEQIGFVMSKKHKKTGPALKLHKVAYPQDIWTDKVYIIEGFESRWNDMDQKRKNLSVYKILCSIPPYAFDSNSKTYGKVLQPDIRMFMQEYAASGGIPNWEENSLAKDPMEQTFKEIKEAIPIPEAIKPEVKREAVNLEDVENVTG